MITSYEVGTKKEQVQYGPALGKTSPAKVKGIHIL